MSDMNVTPDQIKEGRDRRGITQAQLAEELGVSMRTVGNWERGDTIPRNRVGALMQALEIEDAPKGYQWGEQAVRTKIGALAKQRREELGMSRDVAAARAGLRSKQTVMNFEFARSMPRGESLRRIEEMLEWKFGSIDDALMPGTRADTLTMEDFDKWDRTPQERPLESFTTEEVLEEAIRRLASIKSAMGPTMAQSFGYQNHGPANLYGLAANTDPSHLERMAEEESGSSEDKD